MENITTRLLRAARGAAAAAVIAGTALFAACSDNVDESSMFVFKGKSAYSFMSANDSLSDFAFLCTRVKISARSESHFSDLLAMRGNYTVFAPTNEAIQAFLDSVYDTRGFDITQTEDTVADFIVRNSIVDCGKQAAYLTTQLTEGTFPKPNMNDRYLLVSFSGDSIGGHTSIYINNRSRIVSGDNEVSNGYVHAVSSVINMSNSSLPDLIAQTPNMRIFSRLLELTGWSDSIVNYLDLDYEFDHPEYGYAWSARVKAPDHRYYGYTAFVETDSVYERQWGIPAPVLDESGNVTNYSEIDAALTARCREAYPRATSNDLTSSDNAVNQFVSYHLLPERITWDVLVVHSNEMGYGWNNPTQLSIDCWEYYETMGRPRRLLKITEGRQTDGKRLNRHCTYDNSYFGTYDEITVDRPGARVYVTNGDYSINALNGFCYPIDGILVYDDDVPNHVLNERLRFDYASLCPELMSNGIRQRKDNIKTFLPAGYITGLWPSNETRVAYFPYIDGSQDNMQRDEINMTGQYDFTFRLPPVPYEGTWELRMCAPEQPSVFGMFQVYLGTDRANPTPIGLPLDFRIKASNPKIGWRADPESGDLDEMLEIDKTMRIHGYMKNNKHNGRPAGGAAVGQSLRSIRGDYIRMRKILWSGSMKPEETYYVRIKSVLDNPSAGSMIDYIELVPRSVYNGDTPEDPW